MEPTGLVYLEHCGKSYFGDLESGWGDTFLIEYDGSELKIVTDNEVNLPYYGNFDNDTIPVGMTRLMCNLDQGEWRKIGVMLDYNRYREPLAKLFEKVVHCKHCMKPYSGGLVKFGDNDIFTCPSCKSITAVSIYDDESVYCRPMRINISEDIVDLYNAGIISDNPSEVANVFSSYFKNKTLSEIEQELKDSKAPLFIKTSIIEALVEGIVDSF